jgi:NAD(P)H-dependent flavin oxidoreductase YrpB (nitropropane dioxygenase family)
VAGSVRCDRQIDARISGVSTLATPLCDRFGIEHPVFGFAHDIATVAAICHAGGLGVYGATRRFPHEIRDELAEIRRLVGDRPFGVDLVLPPGMPEHNSREAIEAHIPDEHRRFVEHIADKYDVPDPSGPGMRTRFIRSTEIEAEQLEAVFEADVDLFACGIGAPRPAVERAQELGKVTAALIGSHRHVARALDSGVEVIVAQGAEAGAHTGTIGTFTLVPQVVDACGDVPVLAAGGVATGRHLAAALAMGAQGVWTGTIWLTSTEHAARLPAALVGKLLAATSSDTVVTRSESGKTFRQIRSAWSDEWSDAGAPTPLKMPYQDVLVGDLLGAIDEHEVEPLLHSGAGQGIGYASEVRPVATIMDELVADAASVTSTWGART